MFCMHCGEKLIAEARFCPNCGTPVGQASTHAQPPAPPVYQQVHAQAAAAATLAVALPFDLKSGLFKTERCVLLFSSPQSVLVRISDDLYKKILAVSKQGSNYFSQISSLFQALGDYANELAVQPIQVVLANHPGSILIETAQIKKLRISEAFDKSNEMSTSNLDLELQTLDGKYKGTLNQSVLTREKRQALKQLLGNRF